MDYSKYTEEWRKRIVPSAFLMSSLYLDTNGRQNVNQQSEHRLPIFGEQGFLFACLPVFFLPTLAPTNSTWAAPRTGAQLLSTWPGMGKSCVPRAKIDQN